MPKLKRKRRPRPRRTNRSVNEVGQWELTTAEPAEEVPSTLSLLQPSSPVLPAELLESLLTERPPSSNNLKTTPLYTSSSSLESTSYCIGRFSLHGPNLSVLLSRVCSLETDDIQLQILFSSYGRCYLELFCDHHSSVYLGVSACTSLFERCGQLLKKEKARAFSKVVSRFRLQLVMADEEEERVAVMEEGSADPSVEIGSGGSEEEGGTPTLDDLSRVVVVATEREKETPQTQRARSSGSVEVEVWVGGVACTQSDPSSPPLGGNSANLIRIMQLFHSNLSYTVNSRWKGHTFGMMDKPVHRRLSIVSRITQFYKDVKQRKRELYGESEPAYDTGSIRGLTAQLRGYQCRAVQWMLDRERGVEQEEGRMDRLHPLWQRLTVPLGNPSTLYFNPHTGRLTGERYCPPPPPRGGILADEMGLGKTVVVLALLMAHRAPPTINTTRGEEAPEMMEVASGLVSGLNSHPPAPSPLRPPARDSTPLQQQPSASTTSHDKGDTLLVGDGGDNGDTLLVGDEGDTLLVGDKGDTLLESDQVQCVCGATSDSDDGGEEYVQCERCGVWQHSECVHFKSSLHPSSSFSFSFSSFACIKCLLEEPLSSRATLIISPQSILQQWREEIEKHTSPNTLSVLHYEGVKQLYVSPYDMAACDVVLVSYETLSLELNYAISHEVSRKLRYRKRYSAAPSPLPAVNWWRVCLDEAQMVESAATKPAEMCLRLKAVHRWCVTGTPIQRELSDLYGLVLFLNVELYSEPLWYRRLITEPYLKGEHRPMVDLFTSVMWRNSKEDVTHELQLPEQREETHWLTFSLVEAYFYKKQREICSGEANGVLSRIRGNYTLGSLTQDTVQKIMAPLHSLRQACCHPQMVRRCGYIPINNKKSLTMPQLLEKLTVQAKVEAREELRKLILSLNGLAGLYILQEQWGQARQTYEEAISTWTEYKEKEVECDRLQRIHTLESLVWVLEWVDPTTSEHTETLKKEAQELRGQFMRRAERQVRVVALSLLASKKTVHRTQCNQMVCAAMLDPHRIPHNMPHNMPHNNMPPEKKRVARPQTMHEEPKATGSESSSQRETGSGCDETTAAPTTTEDSDASDGTAAAAGTSDGEQEEEEVMETPEAGDGAGDDAVPPPGEEELPEVVWDESDEIATDLASIWLDALYKWAEVKGGPGVAEHMVNMVNSDLLGTPYCRLGGTAIGGDTLREMRTVKLRLLLHIHEMEELRCKNLKLLCQLLPLPSDQAVLEATECHLSLRQGVRGGGGWCSVCVAESSLVSYGRQLFSDYLGSAGQEHGEGSRGVHTFEKIIRSLQAFLRQKHAPKVLLDSGKAILAYIDTLKKEYESLRLLWQTLRQRLSECDELRLATCRMHYTSTTTHDLLLGTDDVSAVHPESWAEKKAEFESERNVATGKLTRSLGQLLYLKNLAKTTDWGSCPVCTRTFGTELHEWNMLPCGHPLCVDCMTQMTRRAWHYWQSETVHLSCPLCRFSCLSSEINTVRPCEGENTGIKGSQSTKIVGVIKTLLAIREESPTAKTLVFSSWLDILTLMSAALTDNDIPHAFLKSSRTFQDNLSEFKTSPSVNVLLLPLQSGSKGLNIVEATHVILMEPGLNVSAELQAIGRVHRMGQTRPTTVHRLIIRDSVEEKIHRLLNSTSNKKEAQSSLTMRELVTLFN